MELQSISLFKDMLWIILIVFLLYCPGSGKEEED